MILHKSSWLLKFLLHLPSWAFAIEQCRVGSDTTSYFTVWLPGLEGLKWNWRARRAQWQAAAVSRKLGFELPRVSHASPYPRDCNPFRYDLANMGTDLVRGWVVMHPGFDRKDNPQPLPYVFLVNTRTGQRIRLDLDTSRETASQPGKYEQFMDWFAWRPVAFGPHIKWLTKIQRRYDYDERCWFYRNVPATPGSAPRVHRQR